MINGIEASKAYLGNVEVKKAYLNGKLLWDNILTQKWKEGNNSSTFFVKGGYLFHQSDNNSGVLFKIGNSNGWSVISGAFFNTDPEYGYGICNGILFKITPTEATQIGAMSGWSFVTGQCLKNETEYASYGICNGGLYRIRETEIMQVGNQYGWTELSGMYSYDSVMNARANAFGINDGMLYRINDLEIIPVDLNIGWSQITSSYRNRSFEHSYAIRNEKLYRIQDTTTEVTLLSSEAELSGWSCVSGNSNTYNNITSPYAHGICNGMLYQLSGTHAEMIDENSGWTDVLSLHFGYWSYAIQNGSLYYIDHTGKNLISSQNDWDYLMTGAIGSTGSMYTAFATRRGKLYGLKDKELKRI